jgi:hypothetical protein
VIPSTDKNLSKWPMAGSVSIDRSSSDMPIPGLEHFENKDHVADSCYINWKGAPRTAVRQLTQARQPADYRQGEINSAAVAFLVLAAIVAAAGLRPASREFGQAA